MQVRFNRATVRNLVAGVSGLTLAALAQAQSTGGTAGVDVSSATTEISAMKTAVLAVGAAVFTVALGIKLWKWVTRSL